MYQGASEDGECPLVVDTSTPSCGDSRFGCWTCTLVDQDKSMAAMIQNDAEKEWMLPLLDVRNALDVRDSDGTRSDYHLRDFRRLNGAVMLFHRKGGEDGEAHRRVSSTVRTSDKSARGLAATCALRSGQGPWHWTARGRAD